MRAVLFLLRRYLFPERGNLVGFALWISVAGVALGIILLMVVLSVMSGFQEVFRENYTRITSEIVVIPRGSKAASPDFRLALEGTKGIAAVTPFTLGAGMIVKGGVGGVILEGIELESSMKVTPWEKLWVVKPDLVEQSKTPYWMWVGKQLADKLKIKQGDSVNVLIADGDNKKVIPFLITGITKFGIYDHDLHQARIDLHTLNDIFGKNAPIEPMYKSKVLPGANIEVVADRMRELFGSVASIRPWSGINQNIFLAVQHQKKLLFFVLEIVVALAAMNVVNLLMMTSHNRRRDVAILSAMGMRFRSVFCFFVAQGAVVGLVGIVVGISLGCLVCHALERFQPALLSEAIYNVTRLPIRIELFDVFIVSTVAFFLCVTFSVVPALRASLARPVDALRYE